ncbi:DUF4136 domain-containing protein [Pontibacter anaerobius]|uniref:DUF4136 domain-containing protein n=1 Tax=Pontibacter anaerobius TaxID=2993940 RepID=A0ABT3RJP0_9BACT|nr:DUF4136 domain-containing protein [Pontibacter anaerobius]MCX2742025.1 DUF4136 domain-containing protein [Pontibacter anaerobius]
MKKTGNLYTSLLLLFLTLASCSRIPQANRQYAYDPTVDFTKFQTFNWYRAEVPKPVAGGAGPQFNLLLDQRVKEAVASELVKDGLRPEVQNPGLLVAYDLAVDASQAPTSDYTFPEGFGYGYSYWFGYRFRYNTAGITNYRPIQSFPAGTLVIDLIDPSTNQLLWRGFAEAGINPTSQDMERISLVVADIMSEFPPTLARSR